MWHALDIHEEIAIGAEIDGQDPFNRYAGNALGMTKTALAFYPGAELIRVNSRQVSLGSSYFIHKQNKIIPLRGLDDIQPSCDRYFSPVELSPVTAADYFRFAYFFTAEGRHHRPLIENAADLRIALPASASARRLLNFVTPLTIDLEEGVLTAEGCTVEVKTGRVYRDTFAVEPGSPLHRVASLDSGLVYETPEFARGELRI